MEERKAKRCSPPSAGGASAAGATKYQRFSELLTRAQQPRHSNDDQKIGREKSPIRTKMQFFQFPNSFVRYIRYTRLPISG